MIKSIIIDDEQSARSTLKSLLAEVEENIEVVAEAGAVEEGVEVIKKHQPDLIFLDIQLKNGTGFDILKQLPEEHQSQVVFVTAFDNYAIQAFQLAAFGYLLKPLEIKQLSQTLGRVKAHLKNKQSIQSRMRVLIENREAQGVHKLIIQNMEGFRVVKLDEVVHLRGEINYTRFFLTNGEKILISKTLKEYDQLLTDFGFLRIHQSNLVNLRHIIEYKKGDGGLVIMSNGNHLDVSRRRKAELLSRFLG